MRSVQAADQSWSEPKMIKAAAEGDNARPREGQAGVAPEPTLIAKMLTHPTRVGILEHLSNGDAAAGEIGEAIGVLPNYVRYHLKILANVGWIEVLRREKARGSDRIVFRLLFTPWLKQAPGAARDRHAAVASATSPATAPCSHVELPVATGIAIPMDQVAQQRVSEVLGSALDQLKAVRAESRQRLEGAQGSVPAIFVRVIADEVTSADGGFLTRGTHGVQRPESSLEVSPPTLTPGN
jgi:DNA-binding transcriptional ArsR family regulator